MAANRKTRELIERARKLQEQQQALDELGLGIKL